jgi:DUF305 family protein family protein
MAKLTILLACAFGAMLGGFAAAAVDDTPAVKGYMAAMQTMHKDMMVDYTGDADVDFVRGMIPHHQGAIDMAKVELAWQGSGDPRACRSGHRRAGERDRHDAGMAQGARQIAQSPMALEARSCENGPKQNGP